MFGRCDAMFRARGEDPVSDMTTILRCGRNTRRIMRFLATTHLLCWITYLSTHTESRLHTRCFLSDVCERDAKSTRLRVTTHTVSQHRNTVNLGTKHAAKHRVRVSMNLTFEPPHRLTRRSLPAGQPGVENTWAAEVEGGSCRFPETPVSPLIPAP